MEVLDGQRIHKTWGLKSEQINSFYCGDMSWFDFNGLLPSWENRHHSRRARLFWL